MATGTSHKLRAKAAQKTLQRHFAALVRVISPLKVAQELFSAEIIDSTTLATVRSLGNTKENKANDVLLVVYHALEKNPSAFEALCNALSSEAASEDIARKMKADFEDLVATGAPIPKKQPKPKAQNVPKQLQPPQPVLVDSDQDFTQPSDYLFKFLMLGNSGVGKSSLLNQFIDKTFSPDCLATIGPAFGSTVVNVGSTSVRMEIWDTGGQEKYRAVTRNYYRGVAGVLLVYDIYDRKTYNALAGWLTDARELVSLNVVIVLVGNKKDLVTDREVTFEEANEFAQENKLSFLETSAKTGENVEEAFLQCTRSILSKIEAGVLDPEHCSGVQYGNVHVHPPPPAPTTTTKKGCSC